MFEGYAATLRSFGELCLAIVTVGLGWLVLYLKRRSIRYRVTTQRIVVERGLFSKRMDQLDIYRIIDYVVDLPFGQRIMGTGNLVLRSMDPTNPEMKLVGLKTDVRALYENLRRATEVEKQRHNVRVIDNEQRNDEP